MAFERIKAWAAEKMIDSLAKKDNATRDLMSVVANIARSIAGGLDYERILTPSDALTQNVWALAASRIIRKNIGKLPLLVVKNKKVQESGPLVEFTKQPAPGVPLSTWLAKSIGQRLAFGRQGWYIEEAVGFGTKYWLHVMQSMNLRAIKNEASSPIDKLARPIVSFDYEGINIPLEKVIYFYEDDYKGGVQGVSPIEAALHEFSADTGTGAFQDYFIHNRASMSAIITPKTGKLDLSEIVKRLRKKGSGIKQAGNIVASDTPIDVAQISIPQSDSQLAEFRPTHIQAGLASIGVPFLMLMMSEATYENLKETKSLFWEETMIPVLTEVCEQLNLFLAPLVDSGASFMFDLTGVEALKPRWEKAGQAVALWDEVMSDNEKRLHLAPVPLPPTQDGNRIFKNAGKIAVDVAPAPGQTEKSGRIEKVRAILLNVNTEKEEVEKLEVPKSALDSIIPIRSKESIDKKQIESPAKTPDKFTGKRGDAAGFTGAERDVIFKRMSLVDGEFERSLGGHLKDLLKREGTAVLEYVKAKLAAGEPLGPASTWLEWGIIEESGDKATGQRGKYVNQSRPSLIEAIKRGGREVVTDIDPDHEFIFTEKHKAKAQKIALTIADDMVKKTIELLDAAVADAITPKSAKQNGDDEEVEEEETREERIIKYISLIYIAEQILMRGEFFGRRDGHRAIQYGVNEGIRQEGKTRHWLTNISDTSRWWHVVMDGQERSVDEPFISGKNNLIYNPGESGIGEEDNYCKCQIWYTR